MSLFDDLFYSGPMLAVFSDENRLRRMLEFESALASAEAACGLFPASAAKAITAECRFEILDLKALQAGAARTGTLALPLVQQLSEAVGRRDAEAAKYVHWGATSQDVIDTGFILQAREALDLIEGAVVGLCAELATLAERHAGTIMAGRTWLQLAVPITFGWKAAGWLDAMLRHRERLREVRERTLVLQFGGAAGTLASLGADGCRVSEKLASILRLAHPDISWHATRDRVGEIASVLGLVTATLGKIAKDVSLLMQTEVAEAFESCGAGRGVSSTMPQKRNPVSCAAILAASARVPALVATVLTGTVQEHERGVGSWPAEWETLPEIFNLCAGALERATELVSGLEIDGERMRTNLELTGGLVMAEAVVTALALHFGKSAAHEFVTRGCQRALQEKGTLREALLGDPEFSTLMAETELDAALDPANYLGASRMSIDRVLQRASAVQLRAGAGFIDLPKFRTHYRWDGPAEKPVLLLSNGLGTNLTMWDRQIPELSREFRVLRYDPRGHGKSSVPPGPYSIEQLGCDVLALVDRLGIERFCFCGLSMGGMVGQWLGVESPERLTGLVLCNTAAKIGTIESWNTRIELVLKGGVEAAIPLVLDRWFTPDFQKNEPDVVARNREMLVSTPPAGYVAGCAAVRDMDQREAVHNICVRTLVIAGAYDPVTPPAEGRYLADNIAGASYVELAAAHLSNVEAPAEFNSAVLQFLVA